MELRNSNTAFKHSFNVAQMLQHVLRGELFILSCNRIIDLPVFIQQLRSRGSFAEPHASGLSHMLSVFLMEHVQYWDKNLIVARLSQPDMEKEIILLINFFVLQVLLHTVKKRCHRL